MAASRFMVLGTSPFRSPKPIFASTPFLFCRPYLSLSMRFYCSSPAPEAITSDTAVPLSSLTQPHPWPEWVAFLDKLRSRGYFDESDAGNASGDHRNHFDVSDVYRDMNLLKDACFRFARDRYDIFRLLSLEDIETVVGSGCPNLLRKAVNSSKRLRAHVGFDEADVCSSCSLRGSCDRAYVMLKEPEAAARTVDVVRVLMYYALDPLVISGEERLPGKDLIDASVKKLLSQLISLSEISPDQSLSLPAVNATSSVKKVVTSLIGRVVNDIEMKRGDWICSKCNFMNFSRNPQCLRCKEDGPKSVGDGVSMKNGDWTCPSCNFMNFSRNIRCLKCKTEGLVRVSADEKEMKKGDWICPQCEFMNFASNKKCLRCPELRPKRQLNPGEWECPSCDFLNYKRNTSCLKCNHQRLREEASTDNEEHVWRRPRSRDEHWSGSTRSADRSTLIRIMVDRSVARSA